MLGVRCKSGIRNDVQGLEWIGKAGMISRLTGLLTGVGHGLDNHHLSIEVSPLH